MNNNTEDMIVGFKYKMVHFIDRGCFSSIYLGQNILNGEKVAIKLQNDHPEMLLHEATILNYMVRNGCIDRIPRIFWFGQHKNQSCLIMNYYDISLQDILFSSSMPIQSVNDLNELTRQMLMCLEDIHKVGVIHRDIKPKNFMMNVIETEGGDNDDDISVHLSLIDFGMASAVMPTESDETHSYTGNMKYMSWFVERTGQMPAKRDDLISVGYIYILAAIYWKLMPISGDFASFFKSTEWKRPEILRRILLAASIADTQWRAIYELIDYSYGLKLEDVPKYFILTKLF